MRFVIKHAGYGSERVGHLTGFVRASNTVIETPTAALLTQGGSVVHVTAEVLQKVFTSPQLLWMPLSNSVQLEVGAKAQGEGITKFAGLQGHVSCATLHNLNELTPLGHFEGDLVPLWTKNGKKMITGDRYMDLMEVFKPDIILAIADGRTTLADGMKRNIKAVDRTCKLLDTCINRYKASKQLEDSSLIGVIAGTGNTTKCESCVQHILKYKEDLSGVALAGITDGTEDSLNVPLENLEDIFKRIGESIPKDLVRFVEGCWNPEVILTAIQHGWDVFDGTYPASLTNAGHALVLNFDVTKEVKDLCIIDLNDAIYKDDFQPILVGCECLACKKHTRAYVQHLLNTREMLSKVLLSIHNLHHFNQMFVHARHHIASNNYGVYKKHIIKQYEASKRHNEAKIKLVGAAEELGQLKKKMCVSNSIQQSVANVVN